MASPNNRFGMKVSTKEIVEEGSDAPFGRMKVGTRTHGSGESARVNVRVHHTPYA